MSTVVSSGAEGFLTVGDPTPVSMPSGTSSAASAPVLTPAFAASTAAQLADKTRDYMVYLECTTSGTATTIAIGPTSTPAYTIILF